MVAIQRNLNDLRKTFYHKNFLSKNDIICPNLRVQISATDLFAKKLTQLWTNSNDPVVLLMRAVCSGFAECRSWQLAAYKCKRDYSAFVQSRDRASA